MEEWVSLILIGGSIFAGTIIPGPSFVVVTQAAMSDRRSGIFTALGVALTSAAFAILALVGLLTILAQIPLVYMLFKIAGGLYLIYLGWCMWNATAPLNSGLEEISRKSASRSFWRGVVIQASNPKAALVYASTFAAFLPETFNLALPVSVVFVVVAVSAGWYSVIAFAASLPGVSAQYRASKKTIDRVSGTLLSALGFGIVVQTAFQAVKHSESP